MNLILAGGDPSRADCSVEKKLSRVRLNKLINPNRPAEHSSVGRPGLGSV